MYFEDGVKKPYIDVAFAQTLVFLLSCLLLSSILVSALLHVLGDEFCRQIVAFCELIVLLAYFYLEAIHLHVDLQLLLLLTCLPWSFALLAHPDLYVFNTVVYFFDFAVIGILFCAYGLEEEFQLGQFVTICFSLVFALLHRSVYSSHALPYAFKLVLDTRIAVLYLLYGVVEETGFVYDKFVVLEHD